MPSSNIGDKEDVVLMIHDYDGTQISLPMCNHNFFFFVLFFLQHPGNIAVDDVNGGRLIFYDFGMMGRYFSIVYWLSATKSIS